MPARITVQSGISAGTSHWIDQRVARVGSDPQSEVCLPTANIAAHALTLEFRDVTCRVYNRSSDNVYVGTQLIAPDQVGAWPETDILQLGNDIELLLDFEDETQKTFNEFEFADDESSVAEIGTTAAAAETQKNSDGLKTVVQLVVTLACLAACVAMLLFKPSEDTGTSNSKLNFATIIADARQSPTTSQELIQRLQFAEAAVVRQDRKAAGRRYANLRDDLVTQRDRFASQNRAPELAILNFIEQRLSELQ